jgi:hypothetical protein
MNLLRKTLRVVLWSIAAVVAIPVLVYLAALAINWRDQPPSLAALALAADEPGLKSVADENNAYVYLLGFGAPREADPLVAGTARAAWIRKLRNNPSLGIETDPGPKTLPDMEQLFEPLRDLSCAIDGGAQCFDALNAARDTIERVTAEQSWLIDRYRLLLSYAEWADITSGDIRSVFPDVSAVLQGRRLYYLHAWLLASAGDADGVRTALDADLELWRLSLRDSSTVLSKMIAEGRFREHLAWGTLILRRLPPEARAAAIPASWRRPLSEEERSMDRAFRGEWRFARTTMRAMTSGAMTIDGTRPSQPGSGSASLSTLTERIDSALAKPFFKVQATLNDHAAALLRVESLLDVPYTELPSALARAHEVVNEKPSGVIDTTYNAIGRYLISAGREYMAGYGVRVADLEGQRRAALLTAELRARDVPLDAVPAALELDPARDPYTGQAFLWLPARTAIAFVGLQNDSRGHFEFLY